MGQCTSRKAAGAYAATTVYQNRPMARPNQNQHQGHDDNKDSSKRSGGSYTRGVTTSFGFKRRPSTAIPLVTDNEPNNKKNTDTIDNNGNDDSLDSLETTTPYPSGRSTPRLAPPKKEANASRITRFGFRQSNKSNRSETTPTENKNNNVEKPRKTVSIAPAPKVKQIQKPIEPNRNKPLKTSIPQPQSNIPAKFTFHSTQLPRPQLPVRVLESKNAKTVANINRKVSTVSQRSEEGGSSKEGSVTEDSGVGSHTSGTNGNLTGDTDTLHGVELMDSSPTFGARRNRNIRSRNLEMIVSGQSFDVRDLDDSAEDGVVTDVAVIPLPRLPSVFGNNSAETRNSGMYGGNNLSSGIVRERTLEYERQLDKNRRKISVTSSEGFSEDYGEEEKSFRDRSCTEKSGLISTRLFSPAKTFRDNRISTRMDKDSSPTSSDDQDWEQGGEAMAEVYSISFSSSDESKDKENSPIPLRLPNRSTHSDLTTNQMSTSGTLPKDNFRSVLLNLDGPKYSNAPENRSVLLSEDPKLFTRSQMSTSGSSSMSTSSGAIPKTLLLPLEERMSTMNSAVSSPKDSLKSVLLSIEDPKFAAVAAASSGTLLDDETSPVDSLISSYTESEEIVSKQKNKCCKSPSTDSKDINEKSPLSPASPGTPTNTSLSLSEGRDFLIDDEIADQPALMFNETITSLDRCDSQRMYDHIERLNSEHLNISDSVATLVDSTPKPFRKSQRSCDGSPAPMRAKHPLLSRTASIDTLSPCESIASDDLMMDFDQSQSSGIDDSTDRLHLNESGALHSLDEATIRSELEHQDSVIAREWSSLLGTHSNKEFPAYNTVRTNNFIRSRTTTPNSVPDSPRSLDRVRGFNSPHLRSARTTHGSPAAYDSDDSLRMTHGSMVNDIVGIKTMLLKLKRVLQETDEDTLMRNEPLNPFDNQVSLKNGFCNGLSNNEQSDVDSIDCESDMSHSSSMEMAELRRQIEFLQSQLEDKDRTVHRLQNQVTKYTLEAHIRSGFEREHETCNAATQTDRVRPMSAGPSLLQSMPTDGNMGPLVSANETTRRSRPQSMIETHSQRTPAPLKLWRKPGEPPPPSRYAQQISLLPRRARSRSRPTPS